MVFETQERMIFLNFNKKALRFITRGLNILYHSVRSLLFVESLTDLILS